MPKLKIQDVLTREIFVVSPALNKVQVITKKDEMAVWFYPAAIRTMVSRGETFNGYTLTGTRELRRL